MARNGIEVGETQVEAVRRTCRYIEANLETPLTLAALGAFVGVSPSHLQRLFKRVTGITPREYADACRLGRLKTRLKERRTVTMALFEAGYGSTSRLYERSVRPARHDAGRVPARRPRREGPLHPRFVSARPAAAGGHRARRVQRLPRRRGRALEAALRAEYPAAEVRRDDAGLNPWADDLIGHLDGRLPHLNLPIDVRATAFQRRVWQELLAIPYGGTKTYSEIARALGQPTAARAVARACATNPVAVLIPCHRVVREGGGLGGYRWGLERKKALLDREKNTDGEIV